MEAEIVGADFGQFLHALPRFLRVCEVRSKAMGNPAIMQPIPPRM